jgi:hypothetical protein
MYAGFFQVPAHPMSGLVPVTSTIYCSKKTALQMPGTMEALTVRSVVVGLLIGTLMCMTNTYFGLQTGWITMGSLQSAILGFGVFKVLQKFGYGHDFTVAENVIVQVSFTCGAVLRSIVHPGWLDPRIACARCTSSCSAALDGSAPGVQ